MASQSQVLWIILKIYIRFYQITSLHGSTIDKDIVPTFMQNDESIEHERNNSSANNSNKSYSLNNS